MEASRFTLFKYCFVNIVIKKVLKERVMNKYRSVIIWLFILILSMSLSLSWDVGKLDDVFNQTILFQVRLPRLLEAMLTGAVLTLAGQVYQIVLNNPLADSFTLGLASGASLGSGIALFWDLVFMVPYIFHYFQFNHTVTCFKCFSDVSQRISCSNAYINGITIWCTIKCIIVFACFD